MSKQLSEMKKQLSYIESTKWMFENNDVLVAENYCPNPIWSLCMIVVILTTI